MTKKYVMVLAFCAFIFAGSLFLTTGMPAAAAVTAAGVIAAICCAMLRYLNGPWVSAWTTLDMIPAGSVFVTRSGTRAVRTCRYHSQKQSEMNECILLSNGQSQYLQDDVTDVRIINV